MTIDEARRILGLEPGDDAAQYVDEFEAAREQIAGMVRDAPNDALALRYQEGLSEFEAALAVVRAQIGRAAARLGAAAPAVPEVAGVPAETVMAGEPAGERELVMAGRRSAGRWVAVLLALVVIGCGGWWLYSRIQEDIELQRQARLVFLERQGSIFVENRRWTDATDVFNEIEALDPGSMIATFGRRSIEAGIEEEQKQFLAYWTGEAQVAVESRRWDDAERALANLTERLPAGEETSKLRERIAEGRRQAARQNALDGARAALAGGDWERVRALADEVLGANSDDPVALALRAEADAGEERQRHDLQRARELLAQARGRDVGVFDAQALEWIREAARLAPADQEIAALYDKLSQYTRTIAVPGDYETIAAAVAAARPRDRIRIGAGTWNESLQIDKAVGLEGAGRDKTVIECAAEEGPVLCWGSTADGGQASRLRLRHRTVAPGPERFSVVLVRGGRVSLSDCEVVDGSGHGVVVIDGGTAALSGCRLAGNGWDGVAVYGEGSRAEIQQCEATGNYEHGIDVWAGGTATVRDSRATGNGRNGIYLASPGEVVLLGNQAADNREFGIVIAGSKGGSVRANKAERNRLGGIAIHRGAIDLEVRDNRATRNSGPGLVLDRGFAARLLEQNLSSGNTAPRQVVDDVELDAESSAEGEE